MRLLVTGFPPFFGRPVNPSQDLIHAIQKKGLGLPDIELTAVLLPVEYTGVEREFTRCLQEFQPDLCLSFGVGGQTMPLRIETVGRNLDDCEFPDNAGEVRQSMPIDLSGAEQLRSKMNLSALQIACCDAGFPTELSEDAGHFVCNHLLYFALQEMDKLPHACPFVFTHLAPAGTGLSEERLRQAVQFMAEWFQYQSNESSLVSR